MTRIHQKTRANRSARKRIIPHPFRSLEAADRLHHRDLPNRQPLELWAELYLLQFALARRVFRHRKPRVIDAPSGITDRDWICVRICKLKAALRKPVRVA